MRIVAFLVAIFVCTLAASALEFGNVVSVPVGVGASISSITLIDAALPATRRWVVYDVDDPSVGAAFGTHCDALAGTCSFVNLFGGGTGTVSTLNVYTTSLAGVQSLATAFDAAPCPYTLDDPTRDLCMEERGAFVEVQGLCIEWSWAFAGALGGAVGIAVVALVLVERWYSRLDFMHTASTKGALAAAVLAFVAVAVVCGIVTALSLSCPPPAPRQATAALLGLREATSTLEAVAASHAAVDSVQSVLQALFNATLAVGAEGTLLTHQLANATAAAQAAGAALDVQAMMLTNATAAYFAAQEQLRQQYADALVWYVQWQAAGAPVALLDEFLFNAVVAISNGIAQSQETTQALATVVLADEVALLCACANSLGGHCIGSRNCVCNPGYFGPGCADYCDCASPAAGHCATNTTCICNFGYYGAGCAQETECANGAYEPGQTACDQTVPCAPGFVGADCDVPVTCNTTNGIGPTLPTDPPTCLGCYLPWSGTNCNVHTTCVNGAPTTAYATCNATEPCAAGWSGANCDVASDCVHGSTSYFLPTDPQGPACPYGCAPGWGGANCDQRLLCANPSGYPSSSTPTAPCAPDVPCPTGFVGAYCNVTVTCATGYGTLPTMPTDAPTCVPTAPCLVSGYGGPNCDQPITCRHGVQMPVYPVDGTQCLGAACQPGWNGPNCDQPCQCLHGTCGSLTSASSATTCVACAANYTNLPQQCNTPVVCANTTLYGLDTTTGACLSCGNGSLLTLPTCGVCPAGTYGYPTCSQSCSTVPNSQNCACTYGGSFPNCCPNCGGYGCNTTTLQCNLPFNPQWMWSTQGLCSIYNNTLWAKGQAALFQIQPLYLTGYPTDGPTPPCTMGGAANRANFGPNFDGVPFCPAVTWFGVPDLRPTANSTRVLTLQFVSLGGGVYGAAGTVLLSMNVAVLSKWFTSPTQNYVNQYPAADAPFVMDVNAIACAAGLVAPTATSWFNAFVAANVGVQWAPGTSASFGTYFPYNTSPFAVGAAAGGNPSTCMPWSAQGSTSAVVGTNSFSSAVCGSWGAWGLLNYNRAGQAPAPLLTTNPTFQDAVLGYGWALVSTYRTVCSATIPGAGSPSATYPWLISANAVSSFFVCNQWVSTPSVCYTSQGYNTNAQYDPCGVAGGNSMGGNPSQSPFVAISPSLARNGPLSLGPSQSYSYYPFFCAPPACAQTTFDTSDMQGIAGTTTPNNLSPSTYACSALGVSAPVQSQQTLCGSSGGTPNVATGWDAASQNAAPYSNPCLSWSWAGMTQAITCPAVNPWLA